MVFLDTLTIVCVGLLVGAELTVSVFINPILWKLDEEVQGQAIGLFVAKLGKAMPFWYVVSLVLLLIETVVERNHAGSAFFMGASAIWASVIVLTLLFLVPINNKLIGVDGSLSNEQRRNHKRWDRLHRLRIVALTTSMVLLVLGTYR